MCQSLAEGGQRCYAHTSKKLAAAKAARNPDRPETMAAYDEALIEHATTPKGRVEVEQWQQFSRDPAERSMLGGVLHKAAVAKHLTARMHVWTTEQVWLEPKAPDMVALEDHMDYEYDYYGPGYDGCECGDGDGYCRCSRYEGLRITKVNAARVAADLLGVEADDPRAQAHISKAIKDLRLDDLDTYEAVSASGYYGDRFTAEWQHPDKVRAWTASLATAEPGLVRDPDGVLPYLADKGHTVTGNPLADVKAALSAENAGMVDERVEAAESLSVVEVPFEQITVEAAHHYERVEPRKAEPVNEKAPKIHGVVVWDKRNSTYVLVDGYHRLKHARAGRALRGTYLMLV